MTDDEKVKRSNDLASYLKANISMKLSDLSGQDGGPIGAASLGIVLGHFCVTAIKGKEPTEVRNLFKIITNLAQEIIDNHLDKKELH